MKIYTPLRYPGGKSKIYPFIKKIILKDFAEPPIYSEPFAGGAGLALKLLLTGVVKEIHINDLDYAIFSFWWILINDKDNLVELIERTPINIETWHKQKHVYMNQEKHTLLENAFATFFLNRTNRSGIMTAGPIGGKKQEGNYKINSRFNKNRLIAIINKIYEYRENIHVYNEDANRFIEKIDKIHNHVFFYLDPPYVKKGPGLYKNAFTLNNHRELSDNIKKLSNKWLVTYDNHELIKEIFSDYKIKEFLLNYHAYSFKKGNELAIFSDELSDVVIEKLQ